MRAYLGHVNREGEYVWWLSLSGPRERGSRQRWHRTVAKGWWSGAWKWCRGRFEFELALGGEDNMAQVRVSLPFVGHAAIGVRVPRWVTRSWVYHRREWGVTVAGGHGQWFELRFGWDHDLDGMDEYYRRKRTRGEDVGFTSMSTRQGLCWRSPGGWRHMRVRMRRSARRRAAGRPS